jgi:hypothetical protein
MIWEANEPLWSSKANRPLINWESKVRRWDLHLASMKSRRSKACSITPIREVAPASSPRVIATGQVSHLNSRANQWSLAPTAATTRCLRSLCTPILVKATRTSRLNGYIRRRIATRTLDTQSTRAHQGSKQLTTRAFQNVTIPKGKLRDGNSALRRRIWSTTILMRWFPLRRPTIPCRFHRLLPKVKFKSRESNSSSSRFRNSITILWGTGEPRLAIFLASSQRLPWTTSRREVQGAPSLRLVLSK